MRIVLSDNMVILLKNPSASRIKNLLELYKKHNLKLKSWHIIGHATPVWQVTNDYGDNNEALMVVGEGINAKIGIYDTKSNVCLADLTVILKEMTNSSTEIYLDGCNTASSEATVVNYILDMSTDIAREMSKVLDCTVSGNRGFVSETFTYIGEWWQEWWTLGYKISYKNGIAE